jgi:hypothetical protein
VTDHRLEDLRAEARYHRERYDLYRAKVYGQRATSPARLRALHLASQTAQARLHAAEARGRTSGQRPSSGM